eukprot:Nitzschia sp. Nitz4//scaffold228_size32365//33//1355//NITZ4_007903-RA/size32365-processed-gene-0.30-mRNA-1//1//CDS//3329542810//3792//frame0
MESSDATTIETSHEDSEEEKETVAPLCTCGYYQYENRLAKASLAGGSVPKKQNWLESSFVHLMAPRRPQNRGSEWNLRNKSSSSAASLPGCHGFLEEHQLVQQLMGAVGDSPDVSLCSDCIDRVAGALEDDTQRLYAEVQAYKTAEEEAKRRAKTFQNVAKRNVEGTEKGYLDEISMLKQEVEAREQELEHLHSLFQEQLDLSDQLEALVDNTYEQHNALELQAISFDDSVQLRSKTLTNIQTEVDQLSIVRLPMALFDLQVDERGLRYPLINQLRLAFRPKGDASESEIRAAWSQATQLLLVLGNLLQYPSSEWKVVPLADCAKLIYRKEIFPLRPGDCKSLMAWNALLDQVIRHAQIVFASQDPPKGNVNSTTTRKNAPPFPSFPSSIGNTELARLDKNDQVGWSQVIHRMASNLLWLSERVSESVALQVSTLAYSAY